MIPTRLAGIILLPRSSCKFLYLKIETEAVTDVEPVLPAKRRMKVGTFKTMSRGTRRGEQMMRLILERAKEERVDEVYVIRFLRK